MADAPRLFLITPPVGDAAAFAPILATALGAVDVACVLIRTARADEGAMQAVVRSLAPLVQARGAAALIRDEARFAARLDVDGVHVEALDLLDEALRASKPQRIVGAGALIDRDAAMTAGEAGVDYVMFGGPGSPETHEAVRDRVAWWAEIFNVPCVGYAQTPDCAGEIAAAGAEFVALCEGLWDRPAAIEATLKDIASRHLAPSEGVP